MADLVDQNMAHEMAERDIVLDPIIEKRPPVKQDHIRLRLRVGDRFLRQIDAVVQAKKVVRALDTEIGQRLFVGIFFDTDGHTGNMIAQFRRDREVGARRDLFDVAGAGRGEFVVVGRGGLCHEGMLARGGGTAKRYARRA